MQWASITGSWEFRGNDDQPRLWDDAPAEGHLPVAVAARLAAVLRRHTTTPDDCWFGLWAGFGFDRHDRGPTLDAARAASTVLVRGPVELRRRATWPRSPPSRAPTCGGRPTGPGASSPTST